MEIKVVNGILSPQHEEFIRFESDQHQAYPNYRVDRGMGYIMKYTTLDFDFFEYLRNLYKISKNKVEVIEGGCGQGNALVDLKRGITVIVTPEELKDYPDLISKREKINGVHFEGLENKIRTTGVTLTRAHAEIAASVEEPYRIDEIKVGPIEQHAFNREYDFILDFMGAAYHSPLSVVPVYARILKRDGLSFVRLIGNTESSLGYYSKIFNRNGLNVVAHSKPIRSTIYFIFQRAW